MPSRRGSAAPARAASGGRRPCSSAASHAMIDVRTSPPPSRRSGSGGRRGTLRVASGEPRPLVVRAERERREDAAAEPARADAVPRVAGAVVDPRPRLRREERQVVGGDVDRPAPRALDARAREPGQQPPQPRLRALGGRQVAAEAVVDAAAESDRAGAAAHEHAPVVRRAEVVEEHPRVDDRLAAGPADLLDQLRRRLREDDVRAEVREVARRRRPAGQRGVHREHDLAARARRRRSVSTTPSRTPLHRRPLVQRRRRRRAPPAAARARAARDGRSRRPDRRRPRGRPARRRGAPARRARARPPGPARPTAAAASTARSIARVLRRRRRHHQHPALAQPDVLAARLRERAHARDDLLRRLARAAARRVVAEHAAAATRATPSSRG